jgi:hypothetical protein
VVPDLSFAFDVNIKSGLSRQGVCCVDSSIPSVRKQMVDVCTRNGWKYVSMKYSGLPFEMRRQLSTEYFATLVAKSEFVISGRFHGVAFCLLTKTPFVAVEGSTPKIASLLKDIFRNTRRCVTLGELGKIDIASYEWTSEEMANIDDYIECSKFRNRQMIKQIRSAIDDSARKEAAI